MADDNMEMELSAEEQEALHQERLAEELQTAYRYFIAARRPIKRRSKKISPR